uniref:Uncharacterized protein n=1 Tax=Oryzias latipes TaxID=8090 RepID=A0A3B3I1A7_ORYLA
AHDPCLTKCREYNSQACVVNAQMNVPPSGQKSVGWSFAGFEESYVHLSENTLHQCPFMELPLSLKGTMAPASPSGIVRLATCGPRHSGGAWSGCGCCSCPLLLVCAFCCWVPCCGQSLPFVLSATDAISSCCWGVPGWPTPSRRGYPSSRPGLRYLNIATGPEGI